MRDVVLLLLHVLVTLAKSLLPGGVRAVVAESLVLKHQLLICNRSRLRAPNLTTLDRLLLGLATLFMRPRRIPMLSVMIKPATLLKFHKALVDGKYRRLFSSFGRQRKPGPKGSFAELIAAIVETKRRNPKFGCVRIAEQISHAFGLDIDKDVVRRVLAQHYRPDDWEGNGPSWLTFIAQAKAKADGSIVREPQPASRRHWSIGFTKASVAGNECTSVYIWIPRSELIPFSPPKNPALGSPA